MFGGKSGIGGKTETDPDFPPIILTGEKLAYASFSGGGDLEHASFSPGKTGMGEKLVYDTGVEIKYIPKMCWFVHYCTLYTTETAGMRCNGTITVNTNQFKYLEVKTRSSTSAVHTRPGAPNSPKI